MAHVTAVVNAYYKTIAYTVVEDNMAVGAAEQRDVLADLTAAGFGSGNPLFDRLNNNGVAFANQAAAQLSVRSNVDIWVYNEAMTTAGATGGAQLLTTPNVSGVGVGNFRLDLLAFKAANGDTASWVLEVRLRHSIIR